MLGGEAYNSCFCALLSDSGSGNGAHNGACDAQRESEAGVVGRKNGVLIGVGSTLLLCPSLLRFQSPCSVPFVMNASVHLDSPRRALGR